MWQDMMGRLRYVSLNQFDYNIHISLKNKFLYVETPKVACSTLKLTLAKLELEDPEYFREDIHRRNLSPLLRPTQIGNMQKLLSSPGFVKFCFVRNPYERLLSAYLNKVVKRHKDTYNSLLCHLGRDQTDLDFEITFDQFVSIIEETPICSLNPHWRQQYYQTFQDSFEFDFVGRLESFNEDLNKLGAMMSVDFDPYVESWDRHKTGSGEKLKEYYPDSLRKRVYRLYEIDFDTFGYSSEI